MRLSKESAAEPPGYRLLAGIRRRWLDGAEALREALLAEASERVGGPDGEWRGEHGGRRGDHELCFRARHAKTCRLPAEGLVGMG